MLMENGKEFLEKLGRGNKAMTYHHAKMIELLNDDRLNPENADELLKVQMEMHKALYKNYSK